METIRDYVRASVNGRKPGAGLTAGLLLGQFDRAGRIAWVSQATGLPQDGTADPMNIDVDADKVRDFLQTRRRQSGGMLTLIGFWRTHLGDLPAPSESDRAVMRRVAARQERHSAPAGTDSEPGRASVRASACSLFVRVSAKEWTFLASRRQRRQFGGQHAAHQVRGPLDAGESFDQVTVRLPLFPTGTSAFGAAGPTITADALSVRA
jgi:hypothetical protein